MVFIILLRTLLISWAGDCASVRDEPKKNLNPYSASSSSFGKADKKKKPVKRRLDPVVKRMLITAAVLLTAVALMLSAGCAKDKTDPRNVGRHDRRSGDILDLFRKMTLPSNISGTEIKRGEKYDIPLDEAVKQMRECSKGFAEYVDSGMAILDTGEYMEQDGIRYNIYALGTSGEDSFVREINVCFNHLDRVVYEYDAISDLWTLLP